MTWPTADVTEVTCDAIWVTCDAGTPVVPQPVVAPATVDQYLELITSYHRGRPKFVAMMQALVAPVVANYNLTQNMPIAYDIDGAVGAQLDVVGEWVGRSRFVTVPIPGVYFSFDDPLLGFNLGVWKGPYDTGTGLTRLDDETYRTLLRAKIAANNWDGTLPSAKAALDIIFPDGETKLLIIDNQDMTMTFGVAGTIPSILFLVLLSQGYIPLKPEGVRANYRITSAGGPLFGFNVQNDFISGFNTGSWGVSPEYYIS
ncbi:DUF2612 domain-containing protein [Bosea sp. 2KB_26]|uniref:DUF2612 domain-containing protein n=1 Tax=Bosea sp. 2KB_26 TaxID=3237475 RepID=UPI003F93C11A